MQGWSWLLLRMFQLENRQRILMKFDMDIKPLEATQNSFFFNFPESPT
jgi:hypothetical protein